jgi:formylmethanofuran dehydrogenase subunit A
VTRIKVNGEVFDTESEYSKCLKKLPKNTFTLKKLVRDGVIESNQKEKFSSYLQVLIDGVIESNQKEKFSSYLQVLIDKKLVEHNGSRYEYKLTKSGKRIKREVL